MCFSIYSADHIHILWVARSYSMRYIRAVKLEFYVAIQCVLLFFSLSVCGCCAWIRVGAFAHQRSLCRLNYKNRWCDILFVYWLPVRLVTLFLLMYRYLLKLLRLSLSFSFCWFPCFAICRLFHITHKYCCLQANRSTYDIITKKKQFFVKGISVFLPLFVLTFSFLGVIIITFHLLL